MFIFTQRYCQVAKPRTHGAVSIQRWLAFSTLSICNSHKGSLWGVRGFACRDKEQCQLMFMQGMGEQRTDLYAHGNASPRP